MSAIETARLLVVDRYADDGGDPRNDGTDLIIHSAAMATLAVAEEQRTANLLVALSMFDPEGRAWVTGADRRNLMDQVRERLGLDS